MTHRKKATTVIAMTTATAIPIILTAAALSSSSFLVRLPPLLGVVVAAGASPTVDVLCTAGPDGEEDCQAVYFEPDILDYASSSSAVDRDDDDGGGGDYFLNAGGCVDSDDPDHDCRALAESGECESNPGFAKYRCAVSCGTCRDFDDAYGRWRDGSGVEPCTDEYSECKNWAAMGECGYNPPFMLVECQRSCMICFEDTNQFGVHQDLPPPDDEDYAGTVAIIESSIEYMKKVWAPSASNNRINYKCRNVDAECSIWALTKCGDDDEEKEYMRTNCAPACQTCHLLDRTIPCPIGEGNDLVFGPGGMNAMFERIMDGGRYNPAALSRPRPRRDDGTPDPGGTDVDGPWIVLLEDFITNEEADAMIAAGHRKGYKRSADVGVENPDGTFEDDENDGRTSTNSWCDVELCQEDPVIGPVVERIAAVTGTRVNNSEHIQLLRYEPGQYYQQHHDYIEYQQGLPCGVRMLTLFLYLNDVEEGGGTRFPFLNITVQPRRRSALLWPSSLDEDPEEKDKRTEHEALPVIRGVKYGANAWIHTRNYREAEENDCT